MKVGRPDKILVERQHQVAAAVHAEIGLPHVMLHIIAASTLQLNLTETERPVNVNVVMNYKVQNLAGKR